VRGHRVVRSGRTGARAPIRTLAVLPLANLTGDSHQDYFVDGLTEQLRSELARITSLDIVSGTSTSRYKHSSESAPEIARQLGEVDALIEGGVTRSADRVRVTLDLVDARTDRQIWAQAYEGQLQDVLRLYADITQAVAHEISAAAGGAPPHRAGAHRTIKPEAYDKFLQASYYSRKWQIGGCTTAEPLLLEAIALEPTFAEAYAELAACNTYPDALGRPASVIVPAAHAAAARAMALDDTLPLAHLALGEVLWKHDLDWAGAAREFKRALELEPNQSITLFADGELLYTSGHIDEGMASLRKGLLLDPLSMDKKTAYAYALRLTGQPAEAAEQFKQVLAIDPEWHGARFFLSASYADLGRHDDAVKAYVEFLKHVLHPEQANALADSVAAAYSRGGWKAFLQRDIDLANDAVRHPGTIWPRPYDRFCSRFWMAWRYGRLGDTDKALTELEAAFEGRDHHMQTIQLDSAFAPLRAHPRFIELTRRIGFPQ
jgi:TolB-like protein